MKLEHVMRLRVALRMLITAGPAFTARRAAVGMMVAVIASCQPAPAVPALAPPILPRGYVPATRSVAECGPTMMRTASMPAGTMDGLQFPIGRGIPLPPAPRGRNVGGKLIVMLRVDEAGRPMRDSIFVTGNTDPSYVREFIAALRTMLFWPAVLDGCNVTSRWSMEVNMGLPR